MLTYNKVIATRIFILICIALCVPALFAQTILTADGHTPAYTQFQNTLGVQPENPDCSHPSFGPHITQTTDNVLGVPVFVFNIHVTPDNDRCINTDRQRLEAKTDTGSPDALKGFDGDTMTYQWKFRLPAGFQPSSHFTHIHQIKGGLQPAASGAPVITLTPRSGSPNIIQLIYQTGAVLTQTNLAPFLDTWVVATEVVKVSTSGTYSIVIKTLNGGQTLLSYSNNNINMFPTQTGQGFIRPKWGIYRSLLDKAALRDEQIHFNDFCVAKAPLACPGGQPTPNFSVSATPSSTTVTAGGTASYTATVTPSNGFNSTVTFGVNGLPSGASASFSPASVSGSGSSKLNISTSSTTPAGTYTLTISGSSGSLNHGATVTLVVNSPVTPDFTLSASPSSQTVTAGGGTSYTVTVGAINGFAGSVALSTGSLPAGVTASFNPATVSGSGTSTLSISTSASASSGTITITGTSGSLSHSAAVGLTVNPANVCSTTTANATWNNTAFPSHSGTFTAAFDATPSVAKESAAVGLSHGAQTAYSGFANLVVFTTTGTIQARNGGAYAAASTINFSAGVSYHFRLAINVTNHTYSIFVTPAGGTEQTVGSNFAFRTEQNTVTSLDHWGALVNTAPGGTLQVCNFAVQ